MSNVGSVSVDVVGDVSRFGSRLRTDILPEADRVGREIGKTLAEQIAKGIKVGLGEGFAGAPAESARKGAESGGAFADAFRSKLAAALKALPKADITADSSDADRKIAELRARLQELSDKRVGIDISDAEARAKVASLREELIKLGNSSPSVQVRTDLAKAVLELGAFEALVKKVDNKRIDVKADADTAGAKTKLGELGSAANSAAGAMGGPLVTAGLALGPAIIPVAAAAVAGIAAIGTAAAGVGAGLGVAFLALKPIIGAVQALGAADNSAAADAAAAATAAKAKANAIASGNAQVTSSEASLANARASAASSAVNSAQQVQTAERSLGNTRASVSAAAVTAGQQEQAAERSLGNTRDQVAAAAVSAAQRVADTRRSLGDAERQSAAGIASANAQVVSSEQSLASAQDRERQAQQSLTDARKSAAQQLQDYQTQLADGALSQRAATLAIEQAKQSLAATNANSSSTQLQREQAQLAYDQAVQHNTDLGLQQQRLRATAAEAAKAGVDGSKQVVAAQQQVVSATQGVGNAQAALAKSQQGVVDARLKGVEQVAKAQEGLATAQRAQVDQQRAGAAQIVTAEQAVANAQRAQVDQQRTGAAQIVTAQQAVANAQRAQADQARQGAASIAAAQESVANAQRALAAAYDQTSSAGVSSANKVALAFAGLSPAGASFARFIYGLKDSFKGLSEAAQNGLLPGLQTAIQGLLPALPGLTKFVGDLAKVMGDLFVQASKALTGPFWTQFFSFIGGSAAGWLKTFAETFGNLVKGAAGLFQALAPVGDLFNTSLLKGSKAFADWATSLGTNTGFQKFLGYIKDNLPAVGALLRDLVKAFDNIIVALAPFGPKIVDGVDKFLKLIANTDPKKLGEAIEGFAGIAVGLKGLSISLGVLDAAFAKSTIGRVTEAILALGAASVYAYKNWPAFKKIADEAGQTLNDLGKDTSGKGLGTTVFDLFVQRLTDTGTQIRAKVYEINDMIVAKIFTVNDAIRDKILAVNDVIRDKIMAVNDRIRDYLLERWADVSRNAAAWWSDITGTISRAWEGLRDRIVTLNDTIRDFLLARWADIRRNASEWWAGIVADITGIWDGFTRWIGEKVGGLGTFLSGAWTGIKIGADLMWGQIVDGIGNIWNTVIDKIKGPLNAILGFIQDHFVTPLNAMLGAVGIDPNAFHIPDIPQFASGGLASIPTGAARHAAGGAVGGWSPHDRADNIPAWLTAREWVQPVDAVDYYGTGVMEALQHKLIPRGLFSGAAHADGGPVRGYADGGSVWDAIKAGIGIGASQTPVGSAIGAASDIGGFISDPVGKFKELVGQILSQIGGSGVFPELAKGALTKVGDGLGAKVQSMLTAVTGAGASGGGGTPYAGPVAAGVEQWRNLALQMLSKEGQDIFLIDTLLRRMNQESGGNPNAINNWDSNALAGTPSKGLMQVIDPTFATYHDPSLSPNIYDPAANIASSILYAKSTYGSLASAYNRPGGYAHGGVVKPILFDSGNVAPPGLFLGENRTGGYEQLDRRGHGGGSMSQADVMRIAAAMADVTVRTSVTASTFDHAMGALL